MKKTLVLMLALCMLFVCLNACSSEDPVQNNGDQNTGSGTGIGLLRYSWDGWGIESKYVKSCELVDRILQALDDMEETGETEEKIADGDLPRGFVAGRVAATPGTLWIEAENKIYRMDPELSQICLVEKHLGKGKILELPEGFSKDVSVAWHYTPYDYYLGTYNPGDDTVELRNVYATDSSVQIRVKKIKMNSEYPSTMILELVSKEAQKVTVRLNCRYSSDVIGRSDYETVDLKANIPQTVELEFDGPARKYHYWVYIKADNTKIEIEINP